MNEVGFESGTAVVTMRREDGIGWLWLRNPPVNALNNEVRRALAEALAAVRGDPLVVAVVIAAEGRLFSGGGDLREIGRPEQAGSLGLGDLNETIEAFPKPVVAALQGRVVGGGVLLAMACHARVGAHDVLLALPEVNLGLVPGAGGTQRLPRLVGVEAALRMVVLSEAMRAESALATGLLDEVVSEGGDLNAHAASRALAIARGRLPWRRTATLPVPGDVVAEALIARYGSLAMERFGDREAMRQAIRQAIRLIARSAELPFGAGVREEREVYGCLARSEQARDLIAGFLAARATDRAGGTQGSMR